MSGKKKQAETKDLSELGDQNSDEMREKLAELCHDQWADWMRYLFEKGGTFNENGTWTMSQDFIKWWTRQMETPYAKLTEGERDSAQCEADKFLAVIEKK